MKNGLLMRKVLIMAVLLVSMLSMEAQVVSFDMINKNRNTDPTAALNNLPAKIVDKIKVVDKENDVASFSGVATNEDKEKVMDLEIDVVNMTNIIFNSAKS